MLLPADAFDPNHTFWDINIVEDSKGSDPQLPFGQFVKAEQFSISCLRQRLRRELPVHRIRDEALDLEQVH